MSCSTTPRKVVEIAAYHNNIPALKMGLSRLKDWIVTQSEFDQITKEAKEAGLCPHPETEEIHMWEFIRGLEERNMDFTNQYRPLSQREEEEMVLNSKSASLCEEWALKKWG